MAGETRNVFISHVHEDDEILRNLKDLLKRNGYAIRDGSIDSSKPNNAQSEEYIKNGILAPRIRWASTLIVLVSSKTKTSPWVAWEIEYAHKHDKRIVGVWEQGAVETDLPENLELYGDAMVGWQADRVMDAITGEINTSFNPEGVELAPRWIARYPCK